MEMTTEIEKSLQEWYKSFTHGEVTYKDGTNFISHINPREELKESNNKNKIKFGKYKGKTIDWIKENDFNYINWCIDNIKGFANKYLSDQT